VVHDHKKDYIFLLFFTILLTLLFHVLHFFSAVRSLPRNLRRAFGTARRKAGHDHKKAHANSFAAWLDARAALRALLQSVDDAAANGELGELLGIGIGGGGDDGVGGEGDDDVNATGVSSDVMAAAEAAVVRDWFR
jgi:hypothetical protein